MNEFVTERFDVKSNPIIKMVGLIMFASLSISIQYYYYYLR
jgi:hypothetical protein